VVDAPEDAEEDVVETTAPSACEPSQTQDVSPWPLTPAKMEAAVEKDWRQRLESMETANKVMHREGHVILI
jgi:hypothetical protein